MAIVTRPIETNSRIEAGGVFALTPSTRQVVGAAVEETLVRNPATSLYRYARREGRDLLRGYGGLFIDESELLQPEQAAKEFGLDGALKFNEPVTREEAEELYDLKRAEQQRKLIMSQGAGGLWQGVATFGAGLGASILDPLNIASVFIPVVGQARFARAVEAAGSTWARTGLRVKQGGIQGLVGAAALEPFVYGVARDEQADYGLADSLLNLAFGTVLGGGLHAAGGLLSDLTNPLTLKEREDALRAAVAAVVEGRPVRVEPAFKQRMWESTTLSRAPEGPPRDVIARMADEAEAARQAEAAQAPEAPAPEAPRRQGLRLPNLSQLGDVRFMGNVDDAGRAQTRLGRRGQDVLVEEAPDGRFYLQREVDAEPVADGDAPQRFWSRKEAEKAARKMGRDTGAEHRAARLPGEYGVGKKHAAKPAWGIYRGLSADDAEIVNAHSDLIGLPRNTPEPRQTPQPVRPPVDLAAEQARARAAFEAVMRDAERSAANVAPEIPDPAPVRSPRRGGGGRAADAAPGVDAGDPVLQESLEDIEAEIDFAVERGEISREELEPVMQEISEIDEQAAAARAGYEQAALCLDRSGGL